jgi:hypothetical protein
MASPKRVVEPRKIQCGYCIHSGSMEIVESFSTIKTYKDSYNGHPIDIAEGWVYEIGLCPECGKVNFLKWLYNQDEQDPQKEELLFPLNGLIPEGTPPEVAKKLSRA